MAEICQKSNVEFAFEVEYSIAGDFDSLPFVAAEKVAFSAAQLAGVKLGLAQPLFPKGYQGTMCRACDGIFDYCIVGVKVAGDKVAVVALCGGHKAQAAFDLAQGIEIGGHILDAFFVGHNDYQVAAEMGLKHGHAQTLAESGIDGHGCGGAGGEIEQKSVTLAQHAQLTALGVEIHSVGVFFKLGQYHESRGKGSVAAQIDLKCGCKPSDAPAVFLFDYKRGLGQVIFACDALHLFGLKPPLQQAHTCGVARIEAVGESFSDKILHYISPIFD